MSALYYLNRYANLLLVVVTVAYVVLTWRTLKALERANRRVLEVEHLGEIKTEVLDPVLAWLIQVSASLRGSQAVGTSLVSLNQESVPRSNDRIDERPYYYRWSIQPPANLWEPGAIIYLGSNERTSGLLRSALFVDARQSHFRAAFSLLQAFLKDWQRFLSDVTTFAADCAIQVQAETALQHNPTTGSLQEFANGDWLVESCIWQILGGSPPYFDIPRHLPPTGLIVVQDQRVARQIAQSRDRQSLTAWVQQGSDLVRARWEQSALGQRRDSLLRKAVGLSDAIERTRLSHFLPGDCEYVGGRTWKLLPRLKNRSIKTKNPE